MHAQNTKTVCLSVLVVVSFWRQYSWTAAFCLIKHRRNNSHTKEETRQTLPKLFVFFPRENPSEHRNLGEWRLEWNGSMALYSRSRRWNEEKLYANPRDPNSMATTTITNDHNLVWFVFRHFGRRTTKFSQRNRCYLCSTWRWRFVSCFFFIEPRPIAYSTQNKTFDLRD